MTIDIFNEPICPPCGSFIRSNASDIESAVNNKKLAVRYHLLNFLDDKSHSKNYSTRAVAATYCVAAQNDPKLYSDFYSGLFASNFQPAEDAAEDRTDGELAQLAKTVGADAERHDVHQVGRRRRHGQGESRERVRDAVGAQRQCHAVRVGRHRVGELPGPDLAHQAPRVAGRW